MPPSSKLKKLFSIGKNKKVQSSSSHSGVATPDSQDVDQSAAETYIQPSGSNPQDRENAAIRQGSEFDENPIKGLMVVDVAIDILSILKEASEASSVLNTLKAVCGVSIKLLELARENILQLSNFKFLIKKIDAHYHVFEAEVRKLEAGEGKDVQDSIDKERFLVSMKSYLETLERVRQIVTLRAQNPLAINSWLQNTRDIDQTKELDVVLDQTFGNFIREVQNQISLRVLKGISNASKLRMTQLLDTAVVANGERIKSLAHGTRYSHITRLNEWIHSMESNKPIFWLHDEAGTGKSAIAAHMCEQWRKEGILAGRFFFNKDDRREFRSLLRFCVTLARDMTAHHPFVQYLILEAFENQVNIDSLSFSEQFRRLVVSIAEMTGERLLTPLVFVVDALDECDEEDAHLLVQYLLNEAQRMTYVRFLLTSRPTKEIESMLRDVSCIDGTDMVLLDIKHGDVERDRDTSIYIRHELQGFPIEDQDIVLECAKGVFLWATLACDALKRSSSRKGILQRFQDNAPNQRLASLYSEVLDASLPQTSSQHDLRLLITVLQGVTLAYNPVSIHSIQSFYPENKDKQVGGEEYVSSYIKRLGSIMKDGTPYLPIYLLHPTFREFIESQRTSAKFYISPLDGHHSIATACLDLIADLKPDAFGEIHPELPLPVQWSRKLIPLSGGEDGPLRYALVFWAFHTSFALQGNEELARRLASFFRNVFLVWMEWASAIEEISECIEALRCLRRSMKTIALLGTLGEDNNTEQWCVDALRFILRNSYSIEKCGLQVWMSALVFTPKDSLVYRSFCQNSLRPLPILLTNYAETFHGNRIVSKSRREMDHAAFSPNGRRLLSNSTGGLCLWNTKSSKLIAELTGGHTQGAICVNFSSDGSLIVSGGADETICLWDGFSGALKMKFPRRHEAAINGVVFALLDSVVVSLPNEGNIICWEISKGIDNLHPTAMQGARHTDSAIGLVKSSSGELVASFSNDTTVRLWQVENLTALGEPMRGPDNVLSGCFSLDATKFIAGYDNGNIIIWNIATQKSLYRFDHDTKTIFTIVPSPDGRTVAACGARFSLLDITTGELAYPLLTGHSDPVWSVAFSKNGKRMVSGSYDKTIRVWDFRRIGTKTIVDGFTLRGHTKYINSVCVTPDGRMVASASGDGTLRLWDTDLFDGDEGGDLADLIHDRTKHLALSPDKTRLLSAGQNGTLQMWDFNTGQKVGDLLHSRQEGVTCICFSSCGQLWASGNSNGNVCLWRSEEKDAAPELHTLRGHKSAVKCIAFRPDSAFIATGSEDHSVILWSVRGCKQIASLNCSSRLSCIAISPNGHSIATLSEDDISLWSLESYDLIGGPLSVRQRGYRYDWMDHMSFSLDGTAVVTRQEGYLTLYNVPDMKCFASMTFYPESYKSENLPSPTPSFSQDGKYIFYGPHSFDFSHLSRTEMHTQFPARDPNAIAANPVSPLFLMNKQAQVHSRRWKTPILSVPPDINVERAPWVAFKNTISFGSLDGRVFILRFPEESI